MQDYKVKTTHINSDINYKEALELQEKMVAQVIGGLSSEHLFICEHSPIYTCGTSADVEKEIIQKTDIQILKTGRGGKITYHDEGQVVAYPIMDLRLRGKDLRKYIEQLQSWIIATLAELGISAHSDRDVGVWVTTSTGEAKIAAIGVRVRKWVTFHGIALNVCPNMDNYKNIIPCGIIGKGVTSTKELGCTETKEEVEKILLSKFEKTFKAKLTP